MNITIKIGTTKIVEELTLGSLYFVASSISGIQKILFNKYQKEISFINSYFDNAIKVPQYLEKNIITLESVKVLQDYFSIPSLLIESYGLYNQLVFVTLKELTKKDIVVIETTGLATDSIIGFFHFFNHFTNSHKDKMIIIVQIQPIGLSYPEFKLKNISQDGLKDFDFWLKNI
jgi:hypothetical protein